MTEKHLSLNISTAGHVDHGKTSLSSAVSKYAALKGWGKARELSQIDNVAEEKSRGITINPTQFDFFTENYRVSFIDCPGHASYIKNMLSGSSSSDAAILVVDVLDGPMTQTNEHIILLKSLQIQRIIIFLNKMDAVGNDAEAMEIAYITELQIRELLEKNGFLDENIRVVYGSALVALTEFSEKTPADKQSTYGIKAIEQLFACIDALPAPVRDIVSPFAMSIEKVFSIEGRGTVVSGKIERGTIKVNDTCDILGLFKDKKGVVITGVEMNKKSMGKAQAGDNVGLLIRSVPRDAILTGQTICAPGTKQLVNVFIAQVYAEPGKKVTPIFTGYKPQLLCKTTHVAVSQSILLDKDMLITRKLETDKEDNSSVDTVKMEIALQKPIVLEVGTRFSLRETNTVATGVILEVLPFCKDTENYKVEEIKAARAKRGLLTESAQGAPTA